jgi:hypothetical protein
MKAGFDVSFFVPESPGFKDSHPWLTHFVRPVSPAARIVESSRGTILKKPTSLSVFYA